MNTAKTMNKIIGIRAELPQHSLIEFEDSDAVFTPLLHRCVSRNNKIDYLEFQVQEVHLS